MCSHLALHFTWRFKLVLDISPSISVASLLEWHIFHVFLCLSTSGVTVDSYSCLDPGIPVNGIRYGQDFSIGSTVSFGCDSGYRLSHEEPLVCEKNHWWSHPLPTCDGKSWREEKVTLLHIFNVGHTFVQVYLSRTGLRIGFKNLHYACAGTSLWCDGHTDTRMHILYMCLCLYVYAFSHVLPVILSPVIMVNTGRFKVRLTRAHVCCHLLSALPQIT